MSDSLMDVAATADREALYAGLQAAALVITELAMDAGRTDSLPAFEAPIRRALRIGRCLGSAEDLAARDAGDHTRHADVTAALRRPRAEGFQP